MKDTPLIGAPMLPTRRLPGPKEGSDLRLVFAPNGSKLAGFASCFPEVHVWDTATGERLPSLPAVYAHAVAFSPRGDQLATADKRSIRIWDLASGKSLADLGWDTAIHGDMKLRYTADGRVLLLSKECLCIWGAQSVAAAQRYRFEPGDHGQDLAVHADGTSVFTSYCPGWTDEPTEPRPWYFCRIDFPSGERSYVVPRERGPWFTPGRRWALLCMDIDANRYEVLDTRTGRRCGALAPPVGRGVYDATQLSANGRYVAWPVYRDRLLQVWDSRMGAMVADIPLGEQFYGAGGAEIPLGFSPTHQILAVIMTRPEVGGQALFFDPLTGALLGVTGHHTSGGSNRRFSPCGRWLAWAQSGSTSAGDAAGPTPDSSGRVYLTNLSPILPQARRWEPADQ